MPDTPVTDHPEPTATVDDALVAEVEAAPDVEAEVEPPAVPRTRRSYLVALGVVVIAWGAGLLGAWMGVK
ncbi:MAG: hypothetical protein ABMA25_20735, partial [Ilumatobacteraceae bacterium]